MIENENSFDKISVNQNGSEVVFTQILGNFAIRFNSVRNAFNLIIISRSDAKSVLKNGKFILDEVSKLASKSKNSRSFKHPNQQNFAKSKRTKYNTAKEEEEDNTPPLEGPG